MKVLQTSDIHLGKRVHGYSMIDDQEFILERMVDAVDEHHPDAMIIAGDVYDRAIPTEEAVSLFGDFLERVTDRDCDVYVYPGIMTRERGCHSADRSWEGTGYTSRASSPGRRTDT